LSPESSISGRREGFEKHIKECCLIDARAKARLSAEASAHSPTRLSSSPGLDSKLFDGLTTPYRGDTPGSAYLSTEQQKRFESDLCKLWVANGWSWNSVNNPQTHDFFQKWRPEANLPDRHKLSGSVLKGELETANAAMHETIKGQIATGMSDGWKNIKRTSLLASMLSVDYKASV
jgi:hypothetical protein